MAAGVCLWLIASLIYKIEISQTLPLTARHRTTVKFIAPQTLPEKTLEIPTEPQSPIHGDEHAQFGVPHVRSQVPRSGHGGDDSGQ